MRQTLSCLNVRSHFVIIPTLWNRYYRYPFFLQIKKQKFKEVSRALKYQMEVLCQIPASTTKSQFLSPSLISLHLSIISPRGHRNCSLFGPSASIVDTAGRLTFWKPNLLTSSSLAAPPLGHTPWALAVLQEERIILFPKLFLLCRGNHS